MEKKKSVGFQISYSHKIIAAFIIINIILLLILSLFTATELGLFSKEPTVTTAITASEDAPVLKIVADQGFKPRNYVNDNGEWAGADVEVIIEAANCLGVRPEIVFSDWITARNTLTEGNADVILGLEIFSDMEGVLKTIPISHDGIHVYGREKIEDAAALSEKKVGLMAESVIISMFELNCEYVEYYTNTEILRALANGEVDYAICHGSIAENIIKDEKLNVVECFRLMESYPAIGVRDDYPKLCEALNEVLRDMANDGTIQKFENKWVDASIGNDSLTKVIERNVKFYFMYLVFVVTVEFLLIIYSLQSRNYSKLMDNNAKLETAVKKAEEANHTKTNFLARMSHDMRTPLNSILNFSAFITGTASLEEAKDYGEKIQAAGSYLETLINDTLGMSRIESGKIVLKPEPYHCFNLESSVKNLLEEKALEKGLKFQVICSENLDKPILVDALRLQQICINILNNAIKFTPEDGTVIFEIQKERETETEETIRFTVADTGIGMSEKFMREELFQPFSQERPGKDNEETGTGLGLSIAKQLVDAMGGTIECQSKEGEGTTFTIRLTAKIAEIDSREDEKTEPDVSGLNGLNVLLCEDHPLNRRIAIQLLEKARCIVDTAENGEEGMQKFVRNSSRYDLILMDIRMPVMDGIEATRRIRKSAVPNAKKIPIIAMTANAYEDDIRDCLNAGMNAHIAKPVRPNTMYKVLMEQMMQEKS